MIQRSIKRAFIWVQANQNRDGGYVFRRNISFQYGSHEMLSSINESAMFPTWFRTLSIAYMTKSLNIPNNFIFHNSPGLQYWV